MSEIVHQEHGKFKIFTGALQADNTIGPLADDIAAFVAQSGAAAKSIGAEFLEAVGRIVVTIGYRDDEPGYPVKVTTASLGKIDTEGDLSHLEQAMAAAASGAGHVICHEIYVTKDHDVMMLIMSHQE